MWMLSKRWKEEIVQTKQEMIAFVTYFKDLLAALKNRLSVHEAVVESFEEAVPIPKNDVIVYCWHVTKKCIHINHIFYMPIVKGLSRGHTRG